MITDKDRWEFLAYGNASSMAWVEYLRTSDGQIIRDDDGYPRYRCFDLGFDTCSDDYETLEEAVDEMILLNKDYEAYQADKEACLDIET